MLPMVHQMPPPGLRAMTGLFTILRKCGDSSSGAERGWGDDISNAIN